MEKVMIFIKHRFPTLWRIMEWCNGIIFWLFYCSRLEKVLPSVLLEFANPPYLYKRLDLSDSDALFKLMNTQNSSDLKYFNPHGIDLKSIKNQFRNHAFLMMGVFDEEILVGYFFLRFFINKQCFVGRLIDKDFRGRGIGPVMNKIMYEISWRIEFQCLSTISKNNIAVMKAHSKNPSMVVLKELQDDYLLVQFVPRNSRP